MDNSYRKPIPKTQREISISQQTPYTQSGPGFQPVGNPNDSSFDPKNRGNQISFKNDTTKPFSVNIKDMDEAILYYMNNIIKPSVIQNNEKINVPFLYGDTERWATIQKQGYYRDKSGKIMMPIIVFRRTSLEKNRNLTNKLDANFPNNLVISSKKYSPKGAYDQFNVLNRKTPQIQYYVTVVPDYVTISYDFVISTYYVEQMNSIIEAINYASDSYWGDPERFKFKASINSFVTNTEIPADNERIVKSTFSLNLFGYIIPEIIQKDLASVKKINEKTQIKFITEITSNINDI
jgi:hypothetical protein